MPEFVLTDTHVANPDPAGTFSAPVSALRFEPRIDLQSRNFGEAQGDITLRGGIFEGTGIQVGGVTVFDPQTGHYTAELPVPPQMLSAPEVKTGAESAFSAFNAPVGMVNYDWGRIVSRGEASVAFGNGSLQRQSLYVGHVLGTPQSGDSVVAVDGGIARSRADGTIRDGDHDFFRSAARVQMISERTQTDLFAGYESKFFGWPNLYTPFGVAETESLQTTLVMLAHRRETESGQFATAAYFRRNRDDYEFDRYRPGLFNPYLHETQVTAGSASWRFLAGEWRFDLRGEVAADSLDSTALNSGRFHSRTYGKLAALASRRWVNDAGAYWELEIGGAYDDTNRDPAAWSPIAEVAWRPAIEVAGARLRWYGQFSESTRVPGYTALNSASGGGLFRGNPNLGRETSRNLEAGLQARAKAWSFDAAVFRRRDDPMVDWTFSAAAPNARSARSVRIDVTGVELVAGGTWRALDVFAGYSWLEKDADYGDASVDASFYGLNFPRHRMTLALVVRLGHGIELRSDNEYRVQEKNLLRTVGGDEALLSSLGIYWRPHENRGVELSLVADNLWASDFQELPAVPAAGRQVTGTAAWRW